MLCGHNPYTGTMTTYPEPTLIFENPELTVRAFSVSEMDNSVYLITMRATGEQVLIDPADDAEELYAFTLDALLNDCPQLELADGEERRVRVMEKEEDFNSIRCRSVRHHSGNQCTDGNRPDLHRSEQCPEPRRCPKYSRRHSHQH